MTTDGVQPQPRPVEQVAPITTDKIRDEAARVHESAMFASETQYEYAKRWRRVDRWIGALTAALAAVAGVGGLSDVLSARWTGFIAVLAAGVGAVATSLGAARTAEQAAAAASSYRALQQDSRIFMSIDCPGLNEVDARRTLQSLVERLQALGAEADLPSRGAWQRAKRQISVGAQDYAIDAKRPTENLTSGTTAEVSRTVVRSEAPLEVRSQDPHM